MLRILSCVFKHKVIRSVGAWWSFSETSDRADDDLHLKVSSTTSNLQLLFDTLLAQLSEVCIQLCIPAYQAPDLFPSSGEAATPDLTRAMPAVIPTYVHECRAMCS
jgi:hypothetical protein